MRDSGRGACHGSGRVVVHTNCAHAGPAGSHGQTDGGVLMGGPAAAVLPYIRIARVDHWFKNSFMLLGVVLAFFYQPELLGWHSVSP